MLHLPQEEHAHDSKFRKLEDGNERIKAIFEEAKANKENLITHKTLEHFLAYFNERNLNSVDINEYSKGRRLQSHG